MKKVTIISVVIGATGMVTNKTERSITRNGMYVPGGNAGRKPLLNEKNNPESQGKIFIIPKDVACKLLSRN